MEPQKNNSARNRKVRTLLVYFVFTYNQEKATKIADTYIVGVQREELCALKGFLMFISG